MKTPPFALKARTATAHAGDSVTPVLLTRHAGRISAYLRSSALPLASFTGAMAAYHMGWVDREGQPAQSQAGKLVRPALCLWACEARGGDLGEALPLAAALEWIHNFTLIHDDIQDGDRKRRGRDTVWSVWGMAQGINAGDALHALAFRLLSQNGHHPQRHLEALRIVADALLVVIEGQALDLRLEGRPDTSLRTYLRMIRSKTGALIGASLEAGAVIGGAPAPVAEALRRAGLLLGTAFQVRDDWLGTWGDSIVTGKSSSSDIGRCKLTYPVVACYSVMHEQQRSRIRALFRDANGDADAVRSVLEEVSGSELTSLAPGHFAQKAVAVVQAAGLPRRFVDDFSEVAHYVANRTR